MTTRFHAMLRFTLVCANIAAGVFVPLHFLYPAAHAQASPQDKPVHVYTITKIVVKGNKAFSADEIITMSGHKVGEEFTRRAADEMKANLTSTGNFGYLDPDAGVHILAEVANDGATTLTIDVVENPAIKTVRITGTGPLKADEIAKLVHRTRVYNVSAFLRDMLAIEGRYKKAGYIAGVAAAAGPDEKTPSVLNIPVVVVRVAEINIFGNRRIATKDIQGQMKTKAGGYYNRSLLERDMAAIYHMTGLENVRYQERDLGSGKIGIDLTLTEKSSYIYLPRKAHTAVKFAAKSIPRLDTKNALVLPLINDPLHDSSPAILLSINGAEPRPFVVDTGLSYTLVIDRRAAEQWKIKPDRETPELGGKDAQGVTLKSVAIHIGKPVSATERDVALPIMQAAIADLTNNFSGGSQPNTAGIIGSGLLRHMYDAVQFDFVARTLTLFSRPAPPLRIPGAVTLPLIPDEACYGIIVPTGKGTVREMIVDTGNEAVLTLPEGMAEEFQPLPAPRSPLKIGQWNGEKEGVLCTLPALKLGGFTEPNIAAVILPGEDTAYLGMKILGRFRFTLDYYNQELTLERAADYQSRLRPRGDICFAVTLRDGKPRVFMIGPKSPAEQAGMAVDDVLLQVDGKPVKQWDNLEIMLHIMGNVGDRANLLLQHPNGKTYTVSYIRPAQFPRDDGKNEPSIGIIAIMKDDFRIFIAQIEPDSPASETGLQAGDEIIEANGEAINKEYVIAMQKRGPHKTGDRADLKIKRQGVEKPIEVHLLYRLPKKQP